MTGAPSRTRTPHARDAHEEPRRQSGDARDRQDREEEQVDARPFDPVGLGDHRVPVQELVEEPAGECERDQLPRKDERAVRVVARSKLPCEGDAADQRQEGERQRSANGDLPRRILERGMLDRSARPEDGDRAVGEPEPEHEAGEHGEQRLEQSDGGDRPRPGATGVHERRLGLAALQREHGHDGQHGQGDQLARRDQEVDRRADDGRGDARLPHRVGQPRREFDRLAEAEPASEHSVERGLRCRQPALELGHAPRHRAPLRQRGPFDGERSLPAEIVQSAQIPGQVEHRVLVADREGRRGRIRRRCRIDVGVERAPVRRLGLVEERAVETGDPHAPLVVEQNLVAGLESEFLRRRGSKPDALSVSLGDHVDVVERVRAGEQAHVERRVGPPRVRRRGGCAEDGHDRGTEPRDRRGLFLERRRAIVHRRVSVRLSDRGVEARAVGRDRVELLLERRASRRRDEERAGRAGHGQERRAADERDRDTREPGEDERRPPPQRVPSHAHVTSDVVDRFRIAAT